MIPNERLKKSVKYLDLDEVKEALREGANPNTCIDEVTTVLLHACEKGHNDIARALVQHGADPWNRGKSGNGMPAIIGAARQGHETMVFNLLHDSFESIGEFHKPEDFNRVTYYRTTLIHHPDRWSELLEHSFHSCPKLTEALLEAMPVWPKLKNETQREQITFKQWQTWMKYSKLPATWMESLHRILPFPSKLPEYKVTRKSFIVNVLAGHSWTRKKAFSWVMKPEHIFETEEILAPSTSPQEKPTTYLEWTLTHLLHGKSQNGAIEEILNWVTREKKGVELLNQHSQAILEAVGAMGSLPILKKFLDAMAFSETQQLLRRAPDLLLSVCKSSENMPHRVRLIQWLTKKHGFKATDEDKKGFNALHTVCSLRGATPSQMKKMLMVMDSTGVSEKEWHLSKSDIPSPMDLLADTHPGLVGYWKAYLEQKSLTQALSPSHLKPGGPRKRM